MVVAVPATVTNSTEPAVRGDEDALSPTTIVLKYLKSQGINSPKPDDIRAAVKMMGRQPGTSGPDVVDGLRVQDMGEDPKGKAPQGGPGVGQRGDVSRQVGTGNPPAVDLGTDPYTNRGSGVSPYAPPGSTTNQGTSGTTSAPPEDDSGGVGVTEMILGALGLGGGGYGMYRYFNRPGAPPVAPTDLPPAGPRTPGMPGATQPDLPFDDPRMRIPPPPQQMELPLPEPPPPVDPRQLEMQVRPVNPADLPPGTQLELPMQRAMQPGGDIRTQLVPPEPPPPAAPPAGPPRRAITGPLPTPDQLNPTSKDLARQILRTLGGRGK